jgi:hypothetical protein
MCSKAPMQALFSFPWAITPVDVYLKESCGAVKTPTTGCICVFFLGKQNFAQL